MPPKGLLLPVADAATVATTVRRQIRQARQPSSASPESLSPLATSRPEGWFGD